MKLDRPLDEVMLVLPADQTIADEHGYRTVLRQAHDELANGALGVEQPLVTLGVKVSRPATEYGYLIPDLERRSGAGFVLKAFEEKPSGLRAQDLRRQPGVAWNAGIFLWTPGMLDDAYEQAQPVSIDYAVMEGAASDGRVLMASMDVGWSDLGTWAALVDALVGGYGEAARVVPPGNQVALLEDDLLVVRRAGKLVLQAGPAGTMQAEQPMALLPAAGGHAPAIAALLDRVNEQEDRA
jgi:mannose-1-phosphate guanylyltransferase